MRLERGELQPHDINVKRVEVGLFNEFNRVSILWLEDYLVSIIMAPPHTLQTVDVETFYGAPRTGKKPTGPTTKRALRYTPRGSQPRVTKSRPREFKLAALSYHYNHEIEEKTGSFLFRSPSHRETAAVFGVPPATFRGWIKNASAIAASKKGTRTIRGHLNTSLWPEMEEALYTKFVEWRKAGKLVQRSWFRRHAFIEFEVLKISTSNLAYTLPFRFSASWFHGFLSRYRISLRFTTNKAQKIPDDYKIPILKWLWYNRKKLMEGPPAETTLPSDSTATLGGYGPSVMINMDETPLPFEYLSGQTYSFKGEKTTWAKSEKSGWDKRQATLILTVFGDSNNRLQPIILFRGKNPPAKSKTDQYHQDVIVRFNEKAYNNENEMVNYITNDLVPALKGEPCFFLMDDARFHKTSAVKSALKDNNIVLSIVPPGCTSLVQPLDVSVNRVFKDFLREEMDSMFGHLLDSMDTGVKSAVGKRRIGITHCVAKAWQRFCQEKAEMVVDSFINLGLTLPTDGSQDHLLSIKGLDGLKYSDLDPSIIANEDLMVQVSDGVNLEDTELDPLEDENEAVDFME